MTLEKRGLRIFFPPMSQQLLAGQGLLIIGASPTRSDKPHSVGLLWTNDQSDSKTFTWQYTTFTRDEHLRPRRDSNP